MSLLAMIFAFLDETPLLRHMRSNIIEPIHEINKMKATKIGISILNRYFVEYFKSGTMHSGCACVNLYVCEYECVSAQV